ncbi:UDP-N-acetylmuramoyl-L-alanine--D-glutamate ligase [Hahella sp. CCB-MM4]|uniref:UDP-N-acetylmuramoyl-L-alanine--D-glutamate ligase n=1 Tax=Hahella sp. (strain CCB-MM4) TaxID=1926491 RepID=UPI000B9C2109|nr:UDP-N-acetylmuramoyl-L-alanine--D-glutamate ligase [Hahella sp. CCB-MM4]OZG71989.1 UDP-N-acetylmuramoyl-L-alanine--D-glutamate ligase [Hahella sp. CCB-MM4]
MTILARDRHIVIVGLGVTGLSCARYLHAKGMSFSVMDTRDVPPGLEELKNLCPDVDIVTGSLDREKLGEASEIWLSPGVALAHPDIAAVSDKVIVRGDVDVFSQEAKAPIIAITGSNGKSTVTSMVGEMAKACGVQVAVGGNLGTPVLDLLAPEVELYVVELSSFQLETTEKLEAKAATVLNLSQDHMDRYPDMMAYHLAKMRVFFGCQHLVLNKDDVLAQPPMIQGAAVTWFSLSSPEPRQFGLVSSGDKHFLAKGNEVLLDTDELRIKGRHNWSNALAALALAEAAGLSLPICLETLKDFTGLEHRCEWVESVNGVDFINDSKATNVGATIAALEGLGPVTAGNLILICGGQGKGQDFSALFDCMERYVHAAVVLGEDRQLLRDGLAAKMPVHEVNTMQEAVSTAASLSNGGDLVLLSPACASLDMFRNYVERGEEFKRWVRAL